MFVYLTIAINFFVIFKRNPRPLLQERNILRGINQITFFLRKQDQVWMHVLDERSPVELSYFCAHVIMLCLARYVQRELSTGFLF